MDGTAGPALQTLPGPLAVLTARPESGEGELGPECTYYVLGTAHVSSGGLPEAPGRCTARQKPCTCRRRCLRPDPTHRLKLRPSQPASHVAESCEDVAKLIRAVRPQVRLHNAAATCLRLPVLLLPLHSQGDSPLVRPAMGYLMQQCTVSHLFLCSGGSGGAVQRAQAHPHSRQNQGAQPSRGAPCSHAAGAAAAVATQQRARHTQGCTGLQGKGCSKEACLHAAERLQQLVVQQTCMGCYCRCIRSPPAIMPLHAAAWCRRC